MSPLLRNSIVVGLLGLVVGAIAVVESKDSLTSRQVDGGPDKLVRADDMPVSVEVKSISLLSPERLQQSKLGVMPDGTQVAYVAGAGADGGMVVLDVFPCVRRRLGSKPTDCMRQLPKGAPEDYGELNRFPALLSSGPDCEPVACSVWLGDAP